MRFIVFGLKLKKIFVNVGMKFNDKKDDCCKKKSCWIKRWNYLNVKKSKWLIKRNVLMRYSSRLK